MKSKLAVVLGISKRIVGWLVVAICLTGLTAASLLLWWRLHGEQVLTVQSNSMVPTFRVGDALIVRPINAAQVRPGQIVTYRRLDQSDVLLSHRLLKIDPATGWLTAKGDASSRNDPTFPPRLLVGRVMAVAPGFGRLLGIIRHPAGLILLVYAPALAIIVSELSRVQRAYEKPAYQLL